VFDIAFSELVVVGIIALVVLGPKRLPEVARAAGRWAGRIRRFVEDVKRDLDSELRRDELAELRKVHQEITETTQLLERSAGGALAAIPEIRPPEPAAPDYLVKALPESAPAEPPARRTKKAKKKTPTASRAKHGRTTRKPR
jgi:sec-independent protein translocase protein TatB